MATSVSEPVMRSEIVRRPYPGERVVESSHPGTMSACGALVGRLMICQIFLASGVTKILEWAGTQGYMGKEFRGFFEWMGTSAEVANFFISAIPFLLAMAVAVELAGGLALFLGYKT